MDVGAIPSIGSATTGISRSSLPSSGDGFGEILVQAVKSLDSLQQEASQSVGALAAGQDVDLHEVMIAQDRAALTMDLALQTRNKLVEAYQEIMRMQL